MSPIVNGTGREVMQSARADIAPRPRRHHCHFPLRLIYASVFCQGYHVLLELHDILTLRTQYPNHSFHRRKSIIHRASANLSSHAAHVRVEKLRDRATVLEENIRHKRVASKAAATRRDKAAEEATEAISKGQERSRELQEKLLVERSRIANLTGRAEHAEMRVGYNVLLYAYDWLQSLP